MKIVFSQVSLVWSCPSSVSHVTMDANVVDRKNVCNNFLFYFPVSYFTLNSADKHFSWGCSSKKPGLINSLRDFAVYDVEFRLCKYNVIHFITVNVLKFRTPKKKEHPKFIFSPHQWNKGKSKILQKEAIASLCKTGYFPQRISGIFLLETKILLYEFLEH